LIVLFLVMVMLMLLLVLVLLLVLLLIAHNLSNLSSTCSSDRLWKEQDSEKRHGREDGRR
jgi:hypothetical protein